MDAFKLMKELKANHEQEVNYLPKETGLHLIESTVSVRTASQSKGKTFLPAVDVTSRGKKNTHTNCACLSEWQQDFSQVQRCQSGGPVEPDQFLWLQHTDLCPRCEPAGQILGHDKGTSCSKQVRPEVHKVIIRLLWPIFFNTLIHI